MIRRVVLAVLAAALIAAPAVEAKDPPSFALWVARWSAQSDKVLDKATEPCDALAKREDDKNTGKCFAAAVLGIYPGLTSEWGRQLGRIAKPQDAKCRAAVHTYWLAARKAFTAFSIFLKAHRSAAMTKISQDQDDEPVLTLGRLKDEAKAKAIRVCG